MVAVTLLVASLITDTVTAAVGHVDGARGRIHRHPVRPAPTATVAVTALVAALITDTVSLA